MRRKRTSSAGRFGRRVGILAHSNFAASFLQAWKRCPPRIWISGLASVSFTAKGWSAGLLAVTLKVGSRMHQLESSSNALGLRAVEVASVGLKLAQRSTVECAPAIRFRGTRQKLSFASDVDASVGHVSPGSGGTSPSSVRR